MKIITVKIRNHQRSHSSKQVRELIGRQFWKAILLVLLLLDAPITLQAQFGYSNNGDGTCTITHYTGAGGAVAIPTNLNGLTVTGIGEGALGNITGGTSLTSITIPNSVTNIGHGAFANNYDLTSVMLPTNLANIQNSLFVGDEMLNYVTIPTSVTSIGAGAFESCYSLVSITIPNGVTNIGDLAFYETGLTSVIIPNSVTSIGGSAFSQTGLTNASIGNSVTNIGGNAFYACGGLTSIIIPASVASIGEEAFMDCSRVTSVFCEGNAPTTGVGTFNLNSINSINPVVYYLPNTTGWPAFSTKTGLPVVLWNPNFKTSGPNFGLRTNQFGFTITNAANLAVVVEACTNLANPVWTPIQTITLTNGSYYFSEPLQTNTSARFYGLGFP